MTKFNKALLAAASSVALFGGALTLITPAPAEAMDRETRQSIGRALLQMSQDMEVYQPEFRQSTNCRTTFYGDTANTYCY